VKAEDDASFREPASARSDSLLRAAFLLVGDWGLAEDLVQATLANVYRAWRRIERAGNPNAYVRRMLVNEAKRAWRRRRVREVFGVRAPEAAVPEVGHQRVEDADQVVRILVTLPPRQRAVVVLRYLEDLPEAEVAALLGCSVGTVKSQSARALDSLRRSVAPDGDLELR
jgi:RNA polymerase sigma-70 factor (sigma-E family)